LPDRPHALAKRELPDREVELVAEDAFTRGLIYVRRETPATSITERDILLVLRKSGVKMTDHVTARVADGVARINASDKTEMRFLVAQGTAAVPGADAELIWAVATTPKQKHHTDTNGQSDFRNLEDTGNVTEGQLLLTVVPATRGKPGVDIFGDTIRPRGGRAANVRRGRNVSVSSDGTQYFARQNGRIRFAYGVLSVESVYEINSSVDYAVGNVDFNGPVIVHGDVRAGFEVCSGDWIEIYGTVEGAHLSAKGDIQIRGGVNGRGKCRIACGGSLSARYLNGATVDAGGDVEVIRSVVHSSVRCGGKFRIITQGARASTITAGGDVDIPVIGSIRAIEVEVGAGMDVVRETGIEKVEEAYRRLLKERQRLRQRLGDLVEQPARVVEVFPVEKRARMAEMLRRYFRIEREHEELSQQRGEFQEMVCRNSEARIKVSRMAWRGATLRIADAQHKIRQPRRGPVEYIAYKGSLTTA